MRIIAGSAKGRRLDTPDEGTRPLPAGRPLGKPEILYPRLDEDLVHAEVERLRKMLED